MQSALMIRVIQQAREHCGILEFMLCRFVIQTPTPALAVDVPMRLLVSGDRKARLTRGKHVRQTREADTRERHARQARETNT